MSSLKIRIETFVVVLIQRLGIVLDSGSVTVLPVSYCTREEPMPAGLCEGLRCRLQMQMVPEDATTRREMTHTKETADGRRKVWTFRSSCGA
jgi:hypothetical protein